MSKKTAVSLLILIVVVLAAALFLRRGSPAKVETPTEAAATLLKNGAVSAGGQATTLSPPTLEPAVEPTTTSLRAGQAAPKPFAAKGPALTKEEVGSVDTFTRAFFEFSRDGAKPQKLIRDFKTLGLDPVAAQDFNSSTGKMLIVRTDESLPGTRYFHAQFFEGDDNKPFLHHVSFEIRPGPDSMERAQAALERNFPDLKPIQKREDYRLWKTKDGDRICWTKRMNVEDLQDHLYNAYQPSDAGTVRVVCELEIHDAESDSEHVH